MKYLYISLVFLLSIVEAFLFYYVVCRRKPAAVTWKKSIPFVVLYIAMIVGVRFELNEIFQLAILASVNYLAGCLFTKTGWVENIKYWLLSYLLCGVTEQIIYSVLRGWISEPTYGYGVADVLTCGFVIMILLMIKQIFGRKDEEEITFSTKIFLFFVLAGCIIAIGISYMAFMAEEISVKRQRQFTFLLLLFAVIAIFLTIIAILHILWQREFFRRQADLENQYNQQQRAYFELLLKKEEETKKFRHDIVSHLICLQDNIRKQRYDDAERYLEDILKELKEIRETQYDVGNETVNVLLNYYFIPIKNQCTISLDGYIGKLDQISRMDICTIFSNIFTNAVEAVGENGSIKIDVIRKEKFAEIIIGNSFDRIAHVSGEGTLQTSKEDKRNHGFGMENVRRAIQKNHGEFQYHVDENWFEVEITLPV